MLLFVIPAFLWRDGAGDRRVSLKLGKQLAWGVRSRAETRETLSQNKVKGKEGRRKEGNKRACNLGVGLSRATETVALPC